MNPIQIGRRRLSEIVWSIIDERVGDFPYEVIEKIIEDQQALREQADYNTGSVPYDDAVELYKITKFFDPRKVAEVGTFIGVSTKVMELACDPIYIYTCDHSNNINLGSEGIIQYPNKSSSEMFADLAEKQVKIDLVYLDGRLTEKDFEPLAKIVHTDTVFVLDDFEGVEKGVVNALMLESAARVLIYPREGRKTAISLPMTMLRVVPQEAT
jgi:hypothetical protein